MTDTVVTDFTANVLYALGGIPAMVDVPGEARRLRRRRLRRGDQPRDAASKSTDGRGRGGPGGRLRR
ncbi:hydroxyethylthiazole kinase [Streptomyces sp. PLK6-54]|uniref:Hydroxyethylthiazole kinase n=1 Tax=Actinacidiphila acidipaludis TaxID=2873382 RepID=A0ABS7QFP6_9ACTN|nr:hydroxyethylthiazole kinase [Streptomyces acidipaludis]